MSVSLVDRIACLGAFSRRTVDAYCKRHELPRWRSKALNELETSAVIRRAVPHRQQPITTVCPCGSFRNLMTLTFDLLTSGSMHAELLPWSICVPSLVLIAQVVFLSQRGHTPLPHTQTRRCHRSLYGRIAGASWVKLEFHGTSFLRSVLVDQLINQSINLICQ